MSIGFPDVLAVDPEGRLLKKKKKRNSDSPDPWKVALLFVPRLRQRPCWYRAVAFLPNCTTRGQQFLHHVTTRPRVHRVSFKCAQHFVRSPGFTLGLEIKTEFN